MVFRAMTGSVIVIGLATCAGCWVDPPEHRVRVVVYSSLDREFSEPLLKAYARRTGTEVIPKFDVESTKTVGLTNLIVVEGARRSGTALGFGEYLKVGVPLTILTTLVGVAWLALTHY